jgi:hypothetical protein
MMTGLNASVGGGFNNRTFITHVARKGQGLLNLNVPESDIDRTNRLHLCALMLGLSGHSVTMNYKMSYKDEYLGEMNEYYMPAGVYRSCRNECTAFAGEICSNLLWSVVLAQQQLVVTGFTAMPADGLIKGTARQIGVVCERKWFNDQVRRVELFDVGGLSPLLVGGRCQATMAWWRRKIVLPAAGPAPAGAAARPSGHERLVEYLVANAMSFGRLLWPCKLVSVPAPWEEVGRQKDHKLQGEVIVNETGANRYTAQLAVRAGLEDPASVVASAMVQENKHQDELRKAAENAPPAIGDMTVAALMAKVALLEETVRAVTEEAAKRGANMDDEVPGPAKPSDVVDKGGTDGNGTEESKE